MVDWASLAKAMEGHLVLPGDATYDLLRRPFNARVNAMPAAVARCVSEKDVVTCVKFAKQHGVSVTMRSGGHGAEGYSAVDGELMIDQGAMQQIRVDTENGVVHVGAGATWGQVDVATYPKGLATPGGGCVEVGVAGLTQGGGFGPIARTHGLTLDNLLSARIVTSRDEKVIEVDEANEPMLFWALRGGGGGNFGVVTQFTFRLAPIGRALLGGMLLYPWATAKTVFQFYRDWMNSGADDHRLTMLPMFFFGPGNAPMAGISLFFNGDPDTGMDYLVPLLKKAGLFKTILGPADGAMLPGTLPAYTGTESTTAWPGLGQYWRSGYLKNDFPDAAIDTFLTQFPQAPMPPAGTRRTIGYRAADLSFGFIESLGGRIASVGKTDTAFYWRDQRFSFTFIGIFDPADATWAAKTKTWADGFRAAMEPYFSGGVYVNYMQAELPNWQQAYYGDNFTKLKQAKQAYDKAHLFKFPQDLLQA
jgi:FAD/FMN-containing dehydrogenase